MYQDVFCFLNLSPFNPIPFYFFLGLFVAFTQCLISLSHSSYCIRLVFSRVLSILASYNRHCYGMLLLMIQFFSSDFFVVISMFAISLICLLSFWLLVCEFPSLHIGLLSVPLQILADAMF